MRILLCVITALAVFLPAPLAAQEYSLSRLDSLCGNREPIIDSAFGANPDLTVLARQGALSPDGNTVAYHYERMWPPFLSGVILDGKNPGTQAVYFENVAGPRWSRDGKRLLMNYIIYEIENDSVMELPIKKEYQQTFWSIDEQRIWYKTNVGIYSSDCGGNDVRFHNGITGIPFGDMKCVQFHSMGDNIPRGMYRLYNINDKTGTLINAPTLDQFRAVLNCDVSPQHSMIAGDFWEYGGDKFNGKNCLGIFDLRTNIFRRVLPSQALGSLYYPIWTYRGTLMVSFVCRNDSAYTIWEIDTNGVFLRQWIGKSDMEALLELQAVDQAPSTVSIKTIFPNPAKTHVTIEYICDTFSPFVITIIDLSGREHLRIESVPIDIGKPDKLVLPISQLRPGFYLVALSISGRRPLYRAMIIE